MDMSRTFDTTRRDKLIDVLSTFLGESELRMNCFLLADTSPELSLPSGDCHAFATTIGTLQCDSLSSVLFTVYLEAALRDLRSRLPICPQADAVLPPDVEYTDDTNFISSLRSYLAYRASTLGTVITDHQHGQNRKKHCFCRQADRIDEECWMTRKFRSLLGDAGYVAHRKQPANAAFRKLWTVWLR